MPKSRRPDLNRRPAHYECDALPAELRRHAHLCRTISDAEVIDVQQITKRFLSRPGCFRCVFHVGRNYLNQLSSASEFRRGWKTKANSHQLCQRTQHWRGKRCHAPRVRKEESIARPSVFARIKFSGPESSKNAQNRRKGVPKPTIWTKIGGFCARI